MLHTSSPIFERILSGVSCLPVIDCHEHMLGPAQMDPLTEPIAALIVSYLPSDLLSAGASMEILRMLQDAEVPTASKWPVFESLWRRTEHTAYARATKLILRDVYGEAQMSLAALERIGEQLAAHDAAYYWRTFDEANIRVILSDCLCLKPDALEKYLRGHDSYPDRWRVMISLPPFHISLVRTAEPDISYGPNWGDIQRIGALADRHITSLDEFLEAVFAVLRRAKERGAVAIKDQCAYDRTLDYPLVSFADAERCFNRVLSDPRTFLGWPEGKPLDDFLFHQYMRFARELDLPVQLHTGHMAGIRNRVDKANAALLTPVLELHQRVRFDLFHGNWPYLGDLLFLVKNYPNVALDCCWLYLIDPLYAEEMLKRAVVTTPHSKVHGFGGDYVDMPEFSAAELKIARHVIASALTDLVERRWLEEDEALRIAADWLFNNPNAFYQLGLEPTGGKSSSH